MEENAFNVLQVAKNNYFYIEKQLLSPFQKISKYEIFENDSGDWIGEIEWKGTERNFCFIPESNYVWNENSLQHLTDFIKKINEDYRKEKEDV